MLLPINDIKSLRLTTKEYGDIINNQFWKNKLIYDNTPLSTLKKYENI